MDAFRLDDFPMRTHDTIRYADTDRQGHVNNAVFATFLETGRVALLYDADAAPAGATGEFVIARLDLAFRAELRWPGRVEIGTGVASLGRSSVALTQALFQDGRCAASARTTIVLIDTATRRATPLAPAARDWLGRWRVSAASDGAEGAEDSRPEQS
ncbi:acyl-CoA thioesterase [Salinarimonas rosea]|uniref:acyl-CoA thioesterase n=1 Tax=Salinarimonas rosea TaxID=552063 RepID=UPI000405B83C|nr:thioesterase family protein [Salinarimonas rosea]